MSAEDVRTTVRQIHTDLQVARLNVINTQMRITDSIASLTGLRSQSPDVALTMQELQKIEDDMSTMIEGLARAAVDIENYEMTL